MRLNPSALGLLLPVAALLSGCAMSNVTSTSALAGSTSPAKTLRGKAYGGQQPVAGGVIELYAFGTGGYGSAGTLLASTTADNAGAFNIDPSQISCPTPQTPVYILSIGGDPGFGPNSAIVLGSVLSECSGIGNAFVTINEISTAALAYEFSHFFGQGQSDGNTNDYFGGPASATQTLDNGFQNLYTLIDMTNGYPRANNSLVTFEGPKLISLGNILGSCVNSGGPSSPPCNSLFQDITGPNGATPNNTLEAAVYLALNPTQNVSSIFALQPIYGASAFPGGLTTPPNDWTLSASYTSSNFGLAVNTHTDTTIDIDTNGRVWFPSNGPSSAGVAYFDPFAGNFSQLFTGNLTHPQQVSIDIDNYVWANDLSSPNVAGFPASSPNAPVTLSLPGTTSTAITTAYDNTMRLAIVAPDGLPALADITGKNSYFEMNYEVPGAYGFIGASLAADVVGGFGIGASELSTPTTFDLYLAPNGSGPTTTYNTTEISYQSYQDPGQIVFTGRDFVGTIGGYSVGADGICIWSQQNCFGMANAGYRHPSGLAIDGAGSLWLADNFSRSVEEIPYVNGSYLNSSNQANNTVIPHDPNNGGTLTNPAGIAIDGAGNVWVSNFGCNTTGCTPGAFTLSEILGAAAPTITPISRQVVINNLAGTMPQVKRSASGSR